MTLRCPSCIRPYDATAGRAETPFDVCEECAVAEVADDADNWFDLSRPPRTANWVEWLRSAWRRAS